MCMIQHTVLRPLNEYRDKIKSVSNSEQIDLLDRCLHNRSKDSVCALPLSADSSPNTAFSLLDAIKIVEQAQPHVATGRPVNSSAVAIEQALAQAKLLSDSQPCPILAISGLLNAGKTSLVAGFLSDEGKSRLLVGSSNQQGTHRFVLWLPEFWRKHQELWSSAMLQLQAIFGIAPEELASDPSIAFQQYNGLCFLDSANLSKDPMSIPLVATDPALDRWGIGLMDCPDVQTGIAEHSNSTNAIDQTTTEEIEAIAAARSNMLAQALKIASAYVVVTSANSIQDQSVSAILEAAAEAKPGLKRILAVNRVPRRYLTSEIATEIREGYREFNLWRVYMAYHFEGPLNRDRLPAVPDSMQTNDPATPWPVFFCIDGLPPVQPPAAVPAEDFIVALGSQLDRSQLVKEMLHATLISLNQQCRQAWSNVEAFAKESERRVRRIHRTIADAALSLSLSEENSRSERTHPTLRLQVSREIVAQIAESLERTAPWWAWPSRRLIRWSDQFRNLASGVTQWVAIPSWISDRASSASNWVRSRWRSGDGGRIISANSFGKAIRNFDSWGDLTNGVEVLPAETLKQIEQIIERFQAESRTRLRDQQLDDYTSEIWNRMSWRQRLWTGIAPAGLLFAPLIAVVMVPLDFGGTTVLVCASMKELLFAGMASVGMAMINSDKMPQIAEHEAAWQQLSDLFAITCDAFGVPRPLANEYPELSLGPTTKKLLESSLPVRVFDQTSLQRRLLSIDPSFSMRLDQVLSTLLSKKPP